MAASTDRVLILGAGPIGLGAALELARFGVPSILIEKHEGTSAHPKTRNFNTRTMEIARGWGPIVYKRLRSIDTPDGWKSPIRFLDTATGREFGKIESKGFEGPGPDVSPALPVMSSQELIEQIMLEAVRASRLIDVRFNTEAVRLHKGGGPADKQAILEVKNRATGRTEMLTGPALVAADGAASLIRSALHLNLEGPQGLSHIVNCYFKADIERHIADRKGVLFFVANDKARGVLQPLDGNGRWLCQINVPADQWSLETFTKDRAGAWVRDAVGVADLEPEILSLGLWKMNATVVDKFVAGRIVICGDAAHQFPPTGGLGVNTGLQGMHNAMWKLAYCVQGKAGWPLLSTYHDERRPVSLRITSQSLQNSMNVARIAAAQASGDNSGIGAEDVITASRRYGNHLGAEFGAAYASSAVIADGTEPPPVEDSYADYVQSATPGCRAPHVWLGRADARFSTHDLIGPNLLLLAAPHANGWCEAAATAGRTLSIPIDIYRLDTAGIAETAAFAEAYALGSEGAVLIRPDGHVAWRSSKSAPPNADFAPIIRKILSLLA